MATEFFGEKYSGITRLTIISLLPYKHTLTHACAHPVYTTPISNRAKGTLTCTYSLMLHWTEYTGILSSFCLCSWLLFISHHIMYLPEVLHYLLMVVEGSCSSIKLKYQNLYIYFPLNQHVRCSLFPLTVIMTTTTI